MEIDKVRDKESSFVPWSYENDQWMSLPHHIRHLPLITRHFDLLSFSIRLLWSQVLKTLFFKFYLNITVKGEDLSDLIAKYPKLLVISNHSSHLDAISIASSIPFSHWRHLYINAARDYFFSSVLMSFFSQHCIGAIPMERAGKGRESLDLCVTLLQKLDKIWLVMFPEGTRSKDGAIHPFKKGVSLLAQKTQTPILFLFLDGAFKLWPKGNFFPPPGGKITLYVGPIQQPVSTEEFYNNYKKWIQTLT